MLSGHKRVKRRCGGENMVSSDNSKGYVCLWETITRKYHTETYIQLKHNIKSDSEIGDEVAERINLAQNRIPWQSLVKVRINIRVT